MNRRSAWTAVLLVFVGLGAIAASIGLPNAWRHPVAGPDAAPQAARSIVYASEQDWIVAQIVRPIAEAAAFDNGHVADLATRHISVVTEGVESNGMPRFAIGGATTSASPLQVVITDHLWAPDAYTELVRRLFGNSTPRHSADGAGANAGGDGTDPHADTDAAGAGALLAALTSPRVETLLEQNRRVSAALTRDIRSPAAHEDAALLIGALVLREAAGRFDDVRGELSQMTAHLAIARALRGETGDRGTGRVTGALANIVLLVSVGRQRDAVSRLVGLNAAAGDAPALRAWTRALRLRATGDWRTLPEPSSASLLERLEYARAVNTRLNSSRMLDFLDRFTPEPIPDWARINLSGHFSVESANRMFRDAVPAEVQEAREVWEALHGGGAAVTPERLLEDLNIDDVTTLQQSPGQPASVEALGWTIWAPFLQRHLCSQIVNTWRSNNGTGRWQSSDRLVMAVTGAFGRLRLFPIVLRRVAGTPDEYVHAMSGATEIERAHPEWITPANWQRLKQRPEMSQTAPQPFPDDTWYTPYVPAGTAFDAIDRSLQANCPRPTLIADIDRWAEQAPYDMWIVWSATWHHLTSLSEVDRMQTAFAPILPYDLDAIVHMRDYLEPTPAQHVQFARDACTLDVEQCGQLGWALIENGQDAEAARTFESWIARARDQVVISNNLSWLVSYYYETNRRDRALSLAQSAGLFNSPGGLITQADLFDRLQRHDEAAAIYRENFEHYGDALPLAAYYFREARRTGESRYASQAASYVRQLFPAGLESIAEGDLREPPRDGIVVKHGSVRSDRIGVRPGDIFVAVDGVRVRNMFQYRLVWRLSDDPHVTMTVWRDGQYQQLRVQVPQRLFGARFDSYRPS